MDTNRAMDGRLEWCCGNYSVMDLVHILRYLIKKRWTKCWKDIECNNQKVLISSMSILSTCLSPSFINQTVFGFIPSFILTIGCPDGVYELMKICWDAKPQSRPTFKTISDTLQSLIQDGKQRQPGKLSAFGNEWMKGKGKGKGIMIQTNRVSLSLSSSFFYLLVVQEDPFPPASTNHQYSNYNTKNTYNTLYN